MTNQNYDEIFKIISAHCSSVTSFPEDKFDWLVEPTSERNYIAHFDFGLNKLEVRHDKIVETYSEFSEEEKKVISLQDYAAIIIAHELGHKLDENCPVMNRIANELFEMDKIALGNAVKLELEHQAWHNAQFIIPYTSVKAFELCRKRYLKTYGA